MNEQTTFDWDSDKLKAVENKYLSFPESGIIRYKPLTNNPTESENKYGNLQFNIEVLEMDTQTVMTHSITSKQYMRELAQIQPMEGKELCVQRKGKEFETHYIVSVV